MMPAPTVAEQEILALSVAHLTASQRRGELTAVEILRAYQARAREVDAATNCFTCLVPDAEAWARAADEHRERTGKLLGNLHGVPCTIKVGASFLPGHLSWALHPSDSSGWRLISA